MRPEGHSAQGRGTTSTAPRGTPHAALAVLLAIAVLTAAGLIAWRSIRSVGAETELAGADESIRVRCSSCDHGWEMTFGEFEKTRKAIQAAGKPALLCDKCGEYSAWKYGGLAPRPGARGLRTPRPEDVANAITNPPAAPRDATKTGEPVGEDDSDEAPDDDTPDDD